MSPNMMLPTVSREDFKMWEVILNDSKLSKNAENTSKSFGIKIDKVRAILSEYERTGCLIVKSKLNFR